MPGARSSFWGFRTNADETELAAPEHPWTLLVEKSEFCCLCWLLAAVVWKTELESKKKDETIFVKIIYEIKIHFDDHSSCTIPPLYPHKALGTTGGA